MGNHSGCYRYVAIGPLPPPIGGDTISFSRLVNSRVLKEAQVELEILDTSRKEKESKFGRKLDGKDLGRAVTLFFQAWGKRKNVDGMLIWANTRFSYTLGLLLILLYKWAGKQVILKLFGAAFESEYRHLPRWYQGIIKRIFNKADTILPQTKGMCLFFEQEFEMTAEKVVHFPNFMPAHPVDLTHKTYTEQVKAVFVGQIRKGKGVFDILEALRRDPEMTCTFYGTVFDRDGEAFFREVEHLPNAQYGGVLQAQQVQEVMSSYEVLILPSFHPGEGYPAVIMEAFFSSIPVIASRWRMIPELVHHQENGFLVEINTPEQIVESIGMIRKDRVQYERMRANSRQTAFQYTEERVIGDILLPRLQPFISKANQPAWSSNLGTKRIDH
ncbi:glycosyltransferase family 4 protein [Brevibacillus sp. 179-C9.3 HS]|uniref:glycosyltransferase family 4 protein n=1 Tax=unclassified Brevibacillus TaxID=2684853 RepID=UPI00399FEE2A